MKLYYVYKSHLTTLLFDNPSTQIWVIEQERLCGYLYWYITNRDSVLLCIWLFVVERFKLYQIGLPEHIHKSKRCIEGYVGPTLWIAPGLPLPPFRFIFTIVWYQSSIWRYYYKVKSVRCMFLITVLRNLYIWSEKGYPAVWF